MAIEFKNLFVSIYRNKDNELIKYIITLLKENKYVILYNKQNCYIIQNHSDLIIKHII